MKKTIALIMMLVLALGLTACGNTVGKIDLEAGQSAIYIQKDGAVSYAVSENFEKDYYNKKDLEEKVNAEVADYNSGGKASVNEAISVEKLKVGGDVATLVLKFATSYDFLSYIRKYNQTEKEQFYIGTIGDNSDCELRGDFVSPDKKTAVTTKELEQMTDTNILIVNEVYQVQVDGTILYISDNCNVDDDVVTTAPVGDGTSYIIYENK